MLLYGVIFRVLINKYYITKLWKKCMQRNPSSERWLIRLSVPFGDWPTKFKISIVNDLNGLDYYISNNNNNNISTIELKQRPLKVNVTPLSELRSSCWQKKQNKRKQNLGWIDSQVKTSQIRRWYHCYHSHVLRLQSSYSF